MDLVFESKPVKNKSYKFESIYDIIIVQLGERPSFQYGDGTIIAPENVNFMEKQTQYGTVKAIGPETKYIKVGDYVAFNMNAGLNFMQAGISYRSMREGEIYCKLIEE